MSTPGRYQFLACELSYYSGKVRPYLRYKNIPFDSVPATEEVYENIIYPQVGWNVVPVVITPDGRTLQDSTDIIGYLEQKYPEPSVLPSTPIQTLVCMLLELYADEWLLIPAMHYRWSFMEQRKFVDLQFGRAAAPTASPLQQMDNPQRFVSYEAFKNSPQALGVNEDTIPEIERSYKEFLDEFQTHLSRYPYLLGHKPCVADFAFCGPLYAHLYRDPVPGFLMKCRAPLVACWVETMNGVLQEAPADVYTVVDGRAVKPSPPAAQPGFLPDDGIPETLFPILQRMFTEQGPVLLDTLQKFREHIKESAGETDVMRVIGGHQFRLGDVTSWRGVFVYPLWMLQRITDYYASLSPRQRQTVDKFLDSFKGGHDLVKADFTGCRVERAALGVKLAGSYKAYL